MSSVPAPLSGPRPLAGSSPGRRAWARAKDRGFRGLCQAAAVSVMLLAALLALYLLLEAWPAIRHFGVSFLADPTWDPPHRLGALSFVYGTLVTSALAMALAVPLGVAAAAFLAEVAPHWLRRTGSFLVELLAAIPSVVYGFWAIFFLAPAVQGLFDWLGGPNTSGDGLFAASLVLAIMILPYIIAISYDVCRAVPRSQREAAMALGASRWQTIWSVVLPYARRGIVGGCFLALGRALGETMAVIMIVGNVPHIDLSLYATGATIPSAIALGLNESGDLQRSALVELGVLLLLVTVIVNCLARVLVWRVGRPRPATVGVPDKPGWRAGLQEALSLVRLLLGLLLRAAPLLLAGYLLHRAFASATGRPGGWPTPWPEVNIAFSTLVLLGALWCLWTLVQKSPARSILVNRLMLSVLGLGFVITLGPLFQILGYITVQGVTALDWDFFVRLPNDLPAGLAHALYGTVVLVALATLLAVPLGVFAAIYLAEYRSRWLAKSVRFIGELLAGVPSIVIGIFAYALLVVPGGPVSLGHFSAWAGAFALAIMMIPTVLRASEEALRLVPQSVREASYSLGASQWQTILRLTVPAALPTIITGICLAVARIAGETAPLLLTVNQTAYWPASLNQDFPYLTYYIYNFSRSPLPEEQRLAWAAALVLLTLIMLVNVAIRLVTGKRQMAAGRAA